MIESIRRISTTLFVLGMLVVGITMVAQLAVNCPTGSECLGAVFSFESYVAEEIGGEAQNSTAQTVEQEGLSNFAIAHMVLQKVGVYVLLLAAVMLITLEIRELHYLKILSARRRR